MPEPEPTHQPQSGAVLDIGGDVGALLIHTDATRDGAEIEVCRTDDPSERTHTEVHARIINSQTVYDALFPTLRAGSYHLLEHPGGPPDPTGPAVQISGGVVTELTLPDR